jgi:hypothetical protein
MIITIKNDDGESVYDVSKIEDEQKKTVLTYLSVR